VAPDANPYLVMLSIFKTGLEGETAKIKKSAPGRSATCRTTSILRSKNFRKADWMRT